MPDNMMAFWLGLPVAEKFCNISPYVYYYNNPLKHIDPDGRKPFMVLLLCSKEKRQQQKYNKIGMVQYLTEKVQLMQLLKLKIQRLK